MLKSKAGNQLVIDGCTVNNFCRSSKFPLLGTFCNYPVVGGSVRNRNFLHLLHLFC